MNIFLKLKELDTMLSKSIYNLNSVNPTLTNLIFALTTVYGTIPIIVIMLIYSNSLFLALVMIAFLGVIFRVVFEHYLKRVIKRKRPSYTKLNSYSFPSTHALSTMTFFILFVLTTPNLALVTVVLLALYVLIIGFSRIFIGAHYISDVIGGWLIGVLLGVATSIIYLAAI